MYENEQCPVKDDERFFSVSCRFQDDVAVYKVIKVTSQNNLSFYRQSEYEDEWSMLSVCMEGIRYSSGT
uniref:Uncharacterized protein n=1 Tax=viral metagenome TaxID=1070528 RepID=A0A6M3KW74_9ZZZZ